MKVLALHTLTLVLTCTVMAGASRAAALNESPVLVGDANVEPAAFPAMEKLAASGSVEAQAALGDMYLMGEGTTQDYAEALRWYRKAADQGSGKAQYSLASMYEAGLGVSEQVNSGAPESSRYDWDAIRASAMRSARRQGLAPLDAQLRVDQQIAQMQQNELRQRQVGDRSQADRARQFQLIRAHMWFNIAASAGYRDAKARREAVARNLTLTDVETAQRLAREWKPQAP